MGAVCLKVTAMRNKAEYLHSQIIIQRANNNHSYTRKQLCNLFESREYS